MEKHLDELDLLRIFQEATKENFEEEKGKEK